MKQALAQWLHRKMKEDERIVFLSGDLGYKTFEPLFQDFPKRAINTGVSEQNMVGVSAGLAIEGFRPFCYSITPFLVLRALEQIRNDLCFQNLPVTLIGNGGGLAYGLQGSSHHCLEDIAVLSALPNLKIYLPSSKAQVIGALEASFAQSGPKYFRLSHVIPSQSDFEGDFSGLKIHFSGSRLGVFTFGNLVTRLHNAILQSGKTSLASLWAVGSLPLEFSQGQIERLRELDEIWVFEEHHSNGGLSSQLALTLQRLGVPVKLKAFTVDEYKDQRLNAYFALLDDAGFSQTDLIGRFQQLEL